jgi:hypothetical protein
MRFERTTGGTQVVRKLIINFIVHINKGKAILVTGFGGP